jgi:hypothetical protein
LHWGSVAVSAGRVGGGGVEEEEEEEEEADHCNFKLKFSLCYTEEITQHFTVKQNLKQAKQQAFCLVLRPFGGTHKM